MTEIQKAHLEEHVEAFAQAHARAHFEMLVRAHAEESLRLNREFCDKIEQANRIKWFAYGAITTWAVLYTLASIYAHL